MNTISTDKDTLSPQPFASKFSSPLVRGSTTLDKSADFLLDSMDSPQRERSFNTSKIFLFNLESPHQIKKFEIPEVETENTPTNKREEAIKSRHRHFPRTDSAVQQILPQEKTASKTNPDFTGHNEQPNHSRGVISAWDLKNLKTEGQKANSREIKTSRGGSSKPEVVNFNKKKSSGYNSARLYFQPKQEDIIAQNVPNESQSIILDMVPDMKGDRIELKGENHEMLSSNLVLINHATNANNQSNHQNARQVRGNNRQTRRLNSILPLQIQAAQEEYLNEFPHQLYKILAILAKYHIRRTLAFCIALTALFLFLQDIIGAPNPNFRKVILVCYAFVCYLLIENIILTKTDTILRWKKIENICTTFDTAIVILLIGAIDLKAIGFIFPTKILLAPLVTNFLFYIYKTETPKRIKGLYCKVRIAYCLQFLLILLKLDGDISWAWQLVILFAWPALGYISLYGLVSAIMFISAFSKLIKKNESENKDYIVLSIGYLWAVMSSSVGVLVLAAIIEASTGGDLSKNLHKYLVVGRYMSGILGIFTLLAYPKLKNFLVLQNTDAQDYVEGLQQKLYVESTIPKIRKEKVEIYLVKLSSTYFSSLNESFYFRSKDSLQQLKKSMRQMKRSKSQILNSKNREKFAVNSFPSKVNKFKKTPNMEDPKQNLDLALQNNSLTNLENDRQPSNIDVFVSPKNTKVCLSEGNEVQTWENQQTKNEANENSCYICYSQAPDGVLAGCGHGGVCADCAVEIMKAQGQCMECRHKVEAVVKIDLVPKLRNIIKGYEVITFNSLH